MEGHIRYQEVIEFIEAGLQTWEEVKRSFFEDEKMTTFLKKAYPVVCLDHHQIDLKLAMNLYMSVLNAAGSSVDESFRKELERKEAFRLKMVEYFETQAMSISLEIRFGALKFALIEKLKRNNLIRILNNYGKESINVTLALMEGRR